MCVLKKFKKIEGMPWFAGPSITDKLEKLKEKYK